MRAPERNHLVTYFPLFASVLLLTALLLPAIDRDIAVNRYLQVFDISQSVNVEDVPRNLHTSSRLEYSKTAARQLSQLSGLEYLRLDDTDALVQTLTHTSFAVKQSTPTSIAWIPAAIALLLLCLRFVPARRL